MRHLGPFFGATEVAKLDASDVTAYITTKRRSGLAVKTIRRGWVVRNPVAMADRPVSAPADPDIRFLDREELEALLRAGADDDRLGRYSPHRGSAYRECSRIR